MDVDTATIIVGTLFVLIVLLMRFAKLKKKFIEKINLLTSLGYVIFAFTSSILFVKMINLAYLTLNNKVTSELIQQNKTYIFFAWLVMGLGSLVAYISLLFEENKNKDTN